MCAADDTPETLLTHFHEKIRQDLAQAPNYTCLETMKRSERASTSRPFTAVDTIRIEVSSVGGKEIYSWPGARHFEDKELTAFVTSGTVASGLFFSTVPNDLFAAGKGALKYRGEEYLDGHRATRYDYAIPQFLSGLTLRVSNASAVVATKGSFWFDPVSLDLVRLDTYADDMPANLRLAEAVIIVHYARVRIGNVDALLPRQGETTLTHLSGAASRNAIEFSQCRAYQSESTISFDAPPEPASAPAAGVREVVLPPGLLVPVILETAIDSKTIALGDPVRTRVREDVRHNGSLVLPAGAVVSGRIRRLEHASVVDPYIVIGVELFEVEWANARADFYGELVESYARKGISAGFGTRGSVTYILQGKISHIDAGTGLLWRVLERPAEPAHQPR